MNKYSGGNFDDFLREEGIFEEVLVLCHTKVDGYKDREHSSLLPEEACVLESVCERNIFDPSF